MAFVLEAYPKKQILYPTELVGTGGAWERLDDGLTYAENIDPRQVSPGDSGIWSNEDRITGLYIKPDFPTSAVGIPCRIGGSGNGSQICQFIGSEENDYMARLAYRSPSSRTRFQWTAYFRFESCDFPTDALENYLMKVATLMYSDTDEADWVYRVSLRWKMDQTLQFRVTLNNPLGDVLAHNWKIDYNVWYGLRFTYNAHGTVHNTENEGLYNDAVDYKVEYCTDGGSWSTITNQTNEALRCGGHNFRFGPCGDNLYDITMYMDDININNNLGTNWIVESFDQTGFDMGERKTGGEWTLWVGPEGNSRHCHIAFDLPEQVGVPLSVRLWFRAMRHTQQFEFFAPALYYPPTEEMHREAVHLLADYEYYYTEWRLNPFTEAAWSWDDDWFDNPAATFRIGPSTPSGATITHAWIEVLTAATAQPVLIYAPHFVTENYDDGGNTKSRIKVWLGISMAGNVQVCYGKTMGDVQNVPHNRSAGTYNSATVRSAVSASAIPFPNPGTEYYIIDTIEGLDPDTTYYFNFLVAGRNQYLFHKAEPWDSPFIEEDPHWVNLPQLTTFPETSDSLNFAFGGDYHTADTRGDMHWAIAHHDPVPVMWWDLGDHVKNYAKWPKHSMRRGYHSDAWPLGYHIHRTMPFYRTWSDHDFLTNNGCKMGAFEFDPTQDEDLNYDILWGGSDGGWYSAYGAMDLFQAFTACFGDAPDDFVFTASTSATPLTVASVGGTIPDDVFPGQTITNITDGSAAVIESINRSNNTITAKGGLHTFVNAIDTVDHFYNPDADLQFQNGDTVRVHCGGLWFKLMYGDKFEFIAMDTRYRRDPHFTPGIDFLDGLAYGPLPKVSGANTGIGSYRLVHSGRDFSTGQYKVQKWDVVYNRTADTYAHVVQGFNGYVTLNKDIFNFAGGELYEIRESGGSDYGDTPEGMATAIAAGHIQREWFINSVRTSTAAIKIMVCEIPFKFDETGDADKWADGDGVGWTTLPVLEKVWEENYWEFQAQRRYILDRLAGTMGMVWINADRHGSAIDDCSNIWDLSPEVNGSPLHCAWNMQQEQKAAWLIRGLCAKHSKWDKWVDNNFVEDYEESIYMQRLGGWAFCETTTNGMTATLYNEYGEIIDNSNHALVAELVGGQTEDPDPLGELTATFVLNYRILDEDFEGTGSGGLEEAWTEYHGETPSVPPTISTGNYWATGLGPTITVNRPGTSHSGDLILAFIAHKDGSTITPPDGSWTQIAQLVKTTTRADTAAVFYKVDGGSEGPTYSFGGALASQQWISLSARVTGWDPAYGMNATGNYSTTEYNDLVDEFTHDQTAINVDNDNSVVFVVDTIRSTVFSTASCSGGWTAGDGSNGYNNNASIRMFVAYKEFDQGSSADTVVTWASGADNGADGIGILFQIKPS